MEYTMEYPPVTELIFTKLGRILDVTAFGEPSVTRRVPLQFVNEDVTLEII